MPASLDTVFRRGGTPVGGAGDLWPLAAEFPTITIETQRCKEAIPFCTLSADEWEHPTFDFYHFDAHLDGLAERAAGGPFGLRLEAAPERLPTLAFEVLIRCQRLAGRRNHASCGADFDRVLALHRTLHDLSQPLVRADHSHALDTWQWVLRLDPRAGLAVQLAALFHDVERLLSEADVRIEHRAAVYQDFKDPHARRGARLADEALDDAGVDEVTRRRVARLITGHERPPSPADLDAPDLALLNDADALSFFSLNSPDYMDYFGPEATRRKVAYTLARLRPAARRRLSHLRLRNDVAALLVEHELLLDTMPNSLGTRLEAIPS
jgi:hypothetical protein